MPPAAFHSTNWVQAEAIREACSQLALKPPTSSCKLHLFSSVSTHPLWLQAEAIGEACSQLAVKPPTSYSGPRPGAPLYHAVVATAQQPELAIPETPSLKASCWSVSLLQ